MFLLVLISMTETWGLVSVNFELKSMISAVHHIFPPPLWQRKTGAINWSSQTLLPNNKTAIRWGVIECLRLTSKCLCKLNPISFQFLLQLVFLIIWNRIYLIPSLTIIIFPSKNEFNSCFMKWKWLANYICDDFYAIHGTFAVRFLLS